MCAFHPSLELDYTCSVCILLVCVFVHLKCTCFGCRVAAWILEIKGSSARKVAC